jgi:hypothetical protein
MYVRWKRQKRDQGETTRAALVRSVRVDGKPRQKVVKYLGIFSTAGRNKWHCSEKAHDYLSEPAEVSRQLSSCLFFVLPQRGRRGRT